MTTPAYRRVLLKVSGESLVGAHDYGIDPEVANQLANEIATVRKEGIEIAIVIGGGNTAVEEALYLTNHSDDVTLIHRRDELRSEKILQERLFQSDKITPLWNKTVDSFQAGEDGSLSHLVLKDTQTGETSTFDADGAFVAIGHAPATELFKGKLPMDDGGYLLVEAGTPKTALPGVFACGDVMDHTYRQAVTAAGTGCMAALDAEKFLGTMDFAKEEAQQAEAAE